jgi:hypothetical protein
LFISAKSEGQNLRGTSLYANTDISSINDIQFEENAETIPTNIIEESPSSLSIEAISRVVKEKSTSQEDLARNIFLWLAWNIDYDQEAYKSRQVKKCSPDDLLFIGKSLCGGFADLFNALCENAGLESRFIQGYAKGSTNESNLQFDAPNHAWNSVKIDGKWYLVDVSWASTVRAQIEQEHDLKKSDTNEYLLQYFKSVPEKFILTHMPEDPIWQLTPSKITINDFQGDAATISAMLNSNAENSVDHEQSILKYESLDSLDRVIRYMERMVEIPTNREREYGLGVAYYYKAQELSKDLNVFTAEKLRSRKRQMDRYYQKSLKELSKVEPQDPQYDFAMLLRQNVEFKLNSSSGAPVF